jgi:hypothetical protein
MNGEVYAAKEEGDPLALTQSSCVYPHGFSAAAEIPVVPGIGPMR